MSVCCFINLSYARPEAPSGKCEVSRHKVYFSHNQKKMSAEARQGLKSFLSGILSRSNYHVRLDAYASRLGDPSYNRLLSKYRAAYVAQYIRKLGFSGKLEDRSHGAIFSEEENHREYRRVDVVVYEVCAENSVQTNEAVISAPVESAAESDEDWSQEEESNEVSSEEEQELSLTESEQSSEESSEDLDSTENEIDEVTEDEFAEVTTDKERVPRKKKLLLELNSFHAEVAAKNNFNGGESVDELVSNVRLSGRIQYAHYLSSKLAVMAEAHLRWYSYSKDLDFEIDEDQENYALKFGLGLSYDFLPWWRAELWGHLNQQIYFEKVNAVDPWTFDLVDNYRFELRNYFKILNGKSYDLEIAPLFAYFTDASEKLKGGIGFGGELSSYFFWKKRLGLHVRYWQNKMDYDDIKSSEITHEDLEIGLRLKWEMN